MSRLRTALTLFGVIAAAGCTGSIDGIACTAVFVYGLNVEVVDSVSGEPVASGATLVLEDPPYVETVTETWDGRTMSGAGERAGTYSVTVSKDGYATWQRSGVVVTADVCHVEPVSLTARLQPAGP